MMEKFIVLCLFIGASDVHPFPTQSSGCRKAESNLVFSISPDNVIDLSHDFTKDSPYWPDSPSGFVLTPIYSGFVFNPVKYFYREKFFSQPEHLGTHMDAPSHFSENGVSAEKVSLSKMIGRGVLINLKQNGERLPPDTLVEIKHILDWENRNGGRIRSGSIVLLYTGYSDVYNDRTAYYGTNMTGPESLTKLHFPGLSPEAAEWLISNRCISAVGIDTASIDYGQSTTFESHRIITAANVIIFENVGHLRQLEDRGKAFKVIALHQKISGGSGAPLRIIAVMD